MKEGDKVRVRELKPCQYAGSRFHDSLCTGDVGAIVEDWGSVCGCVDVKCENGHTGQVPKSALELIKEEPVKTEFKVGDRVKCVKEYMDKGEGKVGTILGKCLYSRGYSVEFDEHIDGHGDCGGKFGHVWNIPPSHLKPVDSPVGAPVMQTILVAINEKKLVGMNYEDKKGEETYRIFKPNTVVEKNGLTVNGYCYLRNEFRGLKMDSIKSAWLLGDAE